MPDRNTIKQQLIDEGFSVINEYNDAPGEEFPDHTHPKDQKLVVLKGTISVTMNGDTKVLEPGDQFFFPANVIHSAKVGSEGCLYIDGEKPSV